MKSIKLNNSTYVHIYLHKIDLTLEEAIISSDTSSLPDYKYQAKQYIDALEDNVCVKFLEELHVICAQRIVEQWEKYSPKRLEERRYKQYLKFKNK